jgi:transposase
LEQRIAKAVEEAVAKATAPLLAEIAVLKSTIIKKDKEIERLKAQISKDSSNSSKPPSQNGFKKVPNLREPSKKHAGGQPGHKGTTLRIPKDLSELVKKGKAEHKIIDETNGASEYDVNWEIDIRIIPIYIERHVPKGMGTAIRYGDDFKGTAAYLMNAQMLPYDRTAEFFADMTDGIINPSSATLQEINERLFEKIDIEPLINDILNGATLNVDDTPVRCTQRLEYGAEQPETAEHTTFSAYIRTYSNETTTVLTANPHKDIHGVEEDKILPRFHGIVSQDFEAKFLNYGRETALCCAHLLRELKGLLTLYLVAWASGMIQLFQTMTAHKNEDVSKGISACNPDLLCEYKGRYDSLLAEGERQLVKMTEKTLGYDKFRLILSRLREHKAKYLLFMCNYAAPATNNLAERDLRHCKTRQKVSGCFRTWDGLIRYAKIHSLIGSARKRGIRVLQALSTGVPK